ncbi:hypothetical protein H4R26_001724 [Coemansia thaxteri]|uniref:Uncharacterized protein n=1 Tax=Coemansia thaxteri TaxID=2663907 RepID=A0A9W8BG83_9FUNG|nr:hypothetical protein H4R26_001724 [Coemansia thaxteri]KAJ2485783.1 hypothetical protein EV174_001513 [Coemansia sp. RSA 2320]
MATKAKRTDSAEGDFGQAAAVSARIPLARGAEGRGRSKSRSRLSAKLVLQPIQPQQHSVGVPAQVAAPGNSTDSNVTIMELQQRLEMMAREKVSLETAIEQEQERMFNQSRRLSGSLSPTALAPVGIGVGIGIGAMSPRWTKSHSRSSSVSSFGGTSVGSVGITETLKADINSLRLRLADAERELVSCYSQSQIYKKELVALRQRLGMRVDDLYLEDPVPSSIRLSHADHAARPRRSQSVSSGASSAGSTPLLARRGSSHHSEYFALPPATAAAATAATVTPRRISQRPRSVLLSPRRSMDDHHGPGGVGVSAASSSFVPTESVSLFSSKATSAPHRAPRNIK